MCGWAREALFRIFLDALPKAALVEADYEYAAACEGGEEFVVSTDMIAEAVDEDELRNGAAAGLEIIFSSWQDAELLGHVRAISSCTVPFHQRL